MEFALATEDWLVLDHQVTRFQVYTRRLFWQRFRFAFSFSPSADLDLLAKARTLHDRYGEVIFEATDQQSYRLRGPRQFRHSSNSAISMSLAPVFEALVAEGLWIAQDDEIETLARTLIAMARSSHGGHKLVPDES